MMRHEQHPTSTAQPPGAPSPDALAQRATREPPPGWVIVLEEGARWPSWVDAHHSGESAVVISEEPGRDAAWLADRVEKAAAELGKASHPVERAILSVRLRATPSVWRRRVELAQALLGSVCRGIGALVIAADGAAAEERHELLTLAGTLAEASAGAGVAVIVSAPPARGPRSRKRRAP